MKTLFKITRIINVIAVIFSFFGLFGLLVTGPLQVLAGILYLIIFPKDKLIYIYFGLATIFFFLWDKNDINYLFAIPVFLIIFLSYIIHFQRSKSESMLS